MRWCPAGFPTIIESLITILTNPICMFIFQVTSWCNVEYRKFDFDKYPLHIRQHLYSCSWKPVVIKVNYVTAVALVIYLNFKNFISYRRVILISFVYEPPIKMWELELVYGEIFPPWHCIKNRLWINIRQCYTMDDYKFLVGGTTNVSIGGLVWRIHQSDLSKLLLPTCISVGKLWRFVDDTNRSLYLRRHWSKIVPVISCQWKPSNRFTNVWCYDYWHKKHPRCVSWHYKVVGKMCTRSGLCRSSILNQYVLF